MLPVVAVALAAAAVLAAAPVMSAELQTAEARHRAARLGAAAAAVPAWFALCLLCGAEGQGPWLAAVLVAALLCFEARGLGVHAGPLRTADAADVQHERATQVAAVFAVGATVLTQREAAAPAFVRTATLAALFFCVLGAVPSAAARRRIGASGYLDGAQRACVAYSAGLLALSLAGCLTA